MRRTICYCEPNQANAGEINTWHFIFSSAVNLPKGTLLKFDLLSEGRDIDWEVPSTSPRKTGNVIYAVLENGKTVHAKESQDPSRFTPDFVFELPEELEAGEKFTIIIGASEPTEATFRKNGNGAQCYSQRRRPFLLYVDTTGKGHFEDPEMFHLDIRGGELSEIKILTPSFVTRNKRFDVIVRFEDEYGNLTSNAPEETMIELSHEHLRENLNWKLFVPETGFISLPNLYFNEPGFYTIQLDNSFTKEAFRSSPIKCFMESTKNLYWGLLHGESERVDSTQNIEACLRHFRDDRSMNFYASSPFESSEETSNDMWKVIAQNIAEFDEPDRYTTFLGCQWVGDAKKEGIRLFLMNKDNKPIMRKKDVKNSSLKRIYKNYQPKELLSIPCFTMGKGFEYDFKDFDPEFERVVEIYNAWGCSERTKKDGNHFPITGNGKNSVSESAEGAVLDALKQNKRFGFVAGGLDDRGCYSSFFDGEQEQYNPGLTGIISTEHSRQSLFDAIYNRSCYATTGARIILGLEVAGVPMGSETNAGDKPGLHVNRHLAGYVAGTCDLKLVEIVRNGDVIQSYKPDGYSFDFAYDDMLPLKDVVIDAKDKNPPFAFYYIRVTQKDGEMAWSSPIWVDYVVGKPVKKGK